MIDLIKKLNTEITENMYETNYEFEGHKIPRVTHILSSMLHEDYLMGWSNYLGFKRQKYKDVLEEAAMKGTYVHNSIEDHIQNNKEPDIESMNPNCQMAVYNAYNSFVKWWNIMSENKAEVLMEETPLVSRYFAGTLDLLIKVHGKIYLIDFKTSNHPSYKYFLQLSAYRYLLKELYNIDIDGCGIVMLNKDTILFNEIILDFSNPFDLNYITQCEQTFFSLLYAYYNRLNTELGFKEVLKNNGNAK